MVTVRLAGAMGAVGEEGKVGAALDGGDVSVRGKLISSVGW